MSDGQDTHVVSLSFPAKPEYIVLGRLALSGLAQVRPVGADTLADVKLALTEACSNSIRHAYREGRAGVVDVQFELNGSRVAVEVTDEGSGFDVDSADDESGPLDEGGLGLAIIRALADELELGRRESGAGSRLRFVKFLPA